MNLLARTLLGAACSMAALGAAAQSAERIWSGGTILTMNDAAMRAEAVAERGGRIVAVGALAEVMKLRGPNTTLIDLGGRTMLPGFVDAHGHAVLGGFQALSANLLAPPDGKVRSIADLQRTLRDWIAANGEVVRKVNLVAGFGYDDSQLAEMRHPTRDELDAVSRDVPIFVVHQSSHLGVLNSKALEVVGYTAQSKDPPGGVIRRRSGGTEPDGVLEEAAFMNAAVKLVTQVGVEGFKAFARAGTELWARFGYTTAQEGRSSAAAVKVMRAIADAGGFPIDVAVYPDVIADRDFIRANVSRSYTNRLRVAGAKLTIDGSPQGFTAWRDRPYYKPVGNYAPGYVGYPAVTAEQVFGVVDWTYANRIQLLTHANGEAASDQLIAALRTAESKHGRGDRRPVLIHGQFLREDQVDAYKQLDVIPSLFPMHTFYWGDWHRDHTVGPVNGENISPTGWVLTRGMKFTTHHDAPVAFPDSMRVLDATVTRRTRSGDILGPQHRVDVITALKAMTIWPAYQHFEEQTKGSIEVGKLADFVILSKDPTAVDPETLDQLQVTETIKEGTTVFALAAQATRSAETGASPARRGPDPFTGFLSAIATHRERGAAPPFVARLVAAGGRTGGVHDATCLTGVLHDLAGAMLAHSDQASDQASGAER